MSKKTGIALALTSLTLTLLTAGAFAQQEEPAAEFRGKVEVTEVLLDVLVTDQDGNVIVGLDKGDFTVEEGGQPVDITGVTFYSNRKFLGSQSSLAALGIDVEKVPESRYFVLFFQDQQHINVDAPGLIARQLDAARYARRWVKRELLLDDYVAVVSYDKRLEVHQDFTRDRELITRAIDRAVTGKDSGGNWPSRMPEESVVGSLTRHLPTGDELRDKTATIYDALTQLAQAAGSVVGRKNLIFFTSGSGFGELSSFSPFVYEPDSRYYPPMMQALNDNNVAVYTVDLVPTATQHTMSNPLNALAEDTGGEYLYLFTNFLTPLREIAQENNGYYLLSYKSTHPAEKAGYQKVEVKVSNPSFRVKAREGYLYGAQNPGAGTTAAGT
jgi:VWFA-related protein